MIGRYTRRVSTSGMPDEVANSGLRSGAFLSVWARRPDSQAFLKSEAVDILSLQDGLLTVVCWCNIVSIDSIGKE